MAAVLFFALAMAVGFTYLSYFVLVPNGIPDALPLPAFFLLVWALLTALGLGASR